MQLRDARHCMNQPVRRNLYYKVTASGKAKNVTSPSTRRRNSRRLFLLQNFDDKKAPNESARTELFLSELKDKD